MSHSALVLTTALFLSGCAGAANIRTLADIAPTGCPTTVASVESAAGKAWWEEQRWRFASDDAAKAAYAKLNEANPSPWPDWMQPQETELPAGTRVQMALGVGQPPDRPGGFATFDLIRSVEDVRSALAVRQAWKPAIDRVVVYEVTRPIKVALGPIGPQVDGDTCRLLPGRYSQLQMLVPPAERMNYLTVVEVRAIK